jgi:hypothetical protein
MVSILKMHHLFLTFPEAWTHLLLEELEIDARTPSPPTALVATTLRPAAPGALAPPRPGVVPHPRPNAPMGGQRNGCRQGRGGRGGPSTNTSGAPSAPSASAPYGGQGIHPLFAHPWAGAVRLWSYDPSGCPTPQPAFHVVPHYGGFGGPPHGAPPPHYGAYYGGDAPLAYQAPAPTYQAVSMPAYQAASWNHTHSGSWNQDSLTH